LWDILPEVVAKEIFKYISFDDVLNVSFVCKNWYYYFGNSEACMDKVQLRIEGWLDLEIITEILSKSPRQYTSIRMDKVNSNKDFEYLRMQDWKDVKLSNMKFASSKDFRKYLLQFGEVLENLEVQRTLFVKDQELCSEHLKLPNLKTLKLIQVPTSAYQPFERYDKLMFLRFDIPAIKGQRMDILQFFELNRGIKLKHLEIYRNSLYALPSDVLEEIESIIISFGKTLKTLVLCDWGNYHTIDHIWDSMVALERFQIGSFINLSKHQSVQPLAINLNLKILEISLIDSAPMKWLTRILSATPNLEELFITILRKEIVHHVAHHLRKLKKLKHQFCLITIDSGLLNSTIYEFTQNPGGQYRYLGPDEIFSYSEIQRRESLKIYKDSTLRASFANSYYQALKDIDLNVNQEIEIIKCHA
jgi:hypothetical protein